MAEPSKNGGKESKPDKKKGKRAVKAKVAGPSPELLAKWAKKGLCFAHMRGKCRVLKTCKWEHPDVSGPQYLKCRYVAPDSDSDSSG
jgi:hypothetical protein